MTLHHPFGRNWHGGLVVLAIIIAGWSLAKWMGWA